MLNLAKNKTMKFKIFTCIFTLFSLFTFSQITVTDSDIISVGDVVYQAVDSIPSSSITIGNSGASQIWDFSNLQIDDVSVINNIDPNNTPFGFMHPTSNICNQEDGQDIYLRNLQMLWR